MDWDRLLKKVTAYSSRRFAQVISILKTGGWSYLQYLDEGLQYIQSARERFHPDESASGEVDSRGMADLRGYYLHLNEQSNS